MTIDARLDLLTDVAALESVCSPAAVTCLKSAVESLNTGYRQNFLRGYRLAVATPLHGLLWFVVDYPELLGFKHDDGLHNWLHFSHRKRTGPLLSAISDPMSDLGRLCSVFNDLQVVLRNSDDGLADTVAAIEKCRAVAAQFNEVLTGTEIVALNTEGELPNRKSILLTCLGERVLDYLEYDPSIVSLDHELVWSGGEDFRPVHDCFVLAADTHLSNVSSSLSGSRFPKEWRQGFWFGLGLVVRLNGIALPSLSDSDPDTWIVQDWLRELLAFVNSSHPEREWPNQVYGLTEFLEPNIRGLTTYLDMNTNTVSFKDKLAAILGPDHVRLIASAGPTDPLELEVMLSGAVIARGESSIRFLLLSYSVASDNREWVSIAFRLPMYGLLSNGSKWFLFYKMYHKGDMFDTDVVRAYKAVGELLARFKDKLDVEEIEGLNSEDFLPLCTLPAFRAMRELSLKAVETNATLRSGNSEMLAALWLVAQGYSNVKVSLKRASLGKSDYDAIGVKDGQCLVLEVKGANILDGKLQKEIRKFADKLKRLRGRLSVLANELEYESEIETVSGLFIFLGDLDDFEPAIPSIPVWGYEDFVRSLRSAGLPPRVVGLLDKSYIIHSMWDGDSPHDPFSVGL